MFYFRPSKVNTIQTNEEIAITMMLVIIMIIMIIRRYD